MSTRKHVWMAALPLLTCVLTGVALGQSATSRLGMYDKDGEAYFALSLLPELKADPGQKNEVVILIDTSASQAGRFRADAQAALGALLASLKAEDRVQVMAIDMNVVPMTDGFVAARDPAMQAALAKLQGRAPLGATDLGAGLRAAAAAFAADNAARSLIYVGDGMSKANLFTAESLGKLVDELRGRKISVSSYAVGMERNGQLLAALANHTGGMALIDSTVDDPQAAGQSLGAAVQASVIWPTSVALSENVAAHYPAEMPPLRSDRDSILIGKLSKAADVNVEVSGTLNGKPVQIACKAAPPKPSEDFAFLPKLVEMAAADKGLSLPTVGSPGLRETALVTLASAVQLTKLGHEALATGNYAGAEKVAAAALARDPGNPEARAIQSAARKAATNGKAAVSEPDLKLTGFVPDQPASSLLEEILAEQPGFLEKVDAERKIVAGKVQAEVESGLADARRLMGQNPEQAEQDLKLILQNIESSTDLAPEMRGQLRQRLESAIRQARRVATEVAARRADLEEQAAIAKERERVNQMLTMHEQQLKQIMDRFDSLMEEGRWQIAESEVAPEVQKLAPGTTLAASAMEGGRLQRAVNENVLLLQSREKNFLATLFEVEKSFVPFPDEPPIIYPSPARWEQLTRAREKYKAVDLGRQGSSEARIFQELNRPTTIEFVEQPLKDVVLYLQEQHNIPIVLASKKLEEASVSPDTPITKNLKGITLRSALRLMLNELELTYVVREEVLQITTPEDAESQLITKVYPVGDLVIPPASLSGGGGMGGMMGGMGMMGGGMGGMGGGMGGMGGMGGGMGGMGGGMGGGMFAVEDELTIGAKKTAAAAPQAAEASVIQPNVQRASAERIVVQPATGQTLAEAWDRFFAERSSLGEESAKKSLFASLRETVRQLMHEKKYSEVSTLIQAALKHGCIEPWMYEAMTLAMRMEGAKTEDLERALLSAVDLAENVNQMLVVAAYMAHAGLHGRALKVYQQVASADPSRPEPFIQGLALAQRLDDVEAIQWACVGLLSQAWTGEQRAIGENAERVSKATYERLLADNRKPEAEAFEAAVRKASQRDCLVKVTWTGDADIDLAVEEPSGTVVSQRQPRSTSGGVHLGDVSAAQGKTTAKGFAEAYMCPSGFAGTYKAMLKAVWGKPTGGKVTIDIYKHYGTDQQQVIHEQIPLGEKNAVVLFDLKEGRRQEPLQEAQVANVAHVQNAVNRAILAQQLQGATNTSTGNSFADSLNAADLFGLGPGFFRRGAVGYRPVIQTIPEGAMFSVGAVVSADRRYVTVGPSPFFTQMVEVNTFNFVTGTGNQQQSGAGGVGGGGFF